jgi:hypothetical protein
MENRPEAMDVGFISIAAHVAGQRRDRSVDTLRLQRDP